MGTQHQQLRFRLRLCTSRSPSIPCSPRRRHVSSLLQLRRGHGALECADVVNSPSVLHVTRAASARVPPHYIIMPPTDSFHSISSEASPGRTLDPYSAVSCSARVGFLPSGQIWTNTICTSAHAPEALRAQFLQRSPIYPCQFSALWPVCCTYYDKQLNLLVRAVLNT